MRLAVTSKIRSILFAVVTTATFGAVVSAPESAVAKGVRISMDWLIGGTHAPFFEAQSKGYFKSEGLDVAIDSGQGASKVAANVAAGAYQFGLVDAVAMVQFNSKNPTTPLIGVYVYFDETALAIITRKTAGVSKPADLAGKKIAGSPGTSAYDSISLIAAPEVASKIVWVPGAPQLMGAFFVKKEVDGLGGFTTSQVAGAVEAGVPLNELSVLRFSDFGLNIYGMVLATTKAYADANPDVVRAVVKAVNKGVLDTISSPDTALAALTARDKMMKPDVERIRLGYALNVIDTPYTKQHGLSTFDPSRMQDTVEKVSAVYKLERRPAVGDLFTEKYLPPLSERTYKASTH